MAKKVMVKDEPKARGTSVPNNKPNKGFKMPPVKGDSLERIATLKGMNVRAAKPVVPGKPVYGKASKGRRK